MKSKVIYNNSQKLTLEAPAMLYQENNSVGQNFFECIRYLDFQYLPHMHKHPELIHVREGMVTVESDGKKEEIEAGGYGLILSNRIHAYHSQKHSVVDVCIFSEDNVPLFSKEVQRTKAQTNRICLPPGDQCLCRSNALCHRLYPKTLRPESCTIRCAGTISRSGGVVS